MPIRFPRDWKKGETPVCQICMRESVNNPSPDGIIDYYGGVAERECKNCKRLFCPIHFSNPEQLCSDCNAKQDKDKIE